jgi:two-component system, NtrC family, sensor kinase
MSSRLGMALLLAVGLMLPLRAQTPAADSLRQLLAAQPRPDTLRVRRLHTLAALLYNSPAESEQLIQQALTLARRLHDATGEGNALLWLCTLHRGAYAYDAARRCARRARWVFARSRNPDGQARAELHLGLTELQQGNLLAALAATQRGQQLAERASSRLTLARLRANVGNIYTQMQDYASALPVLHRVLRDGEALRDPALVGFALNSLGNAYQLERNWPQARRYYLRALALNRAQGDASNETTNETNLAEVFRQLGDLKQAEAHGRAALRLATRRGDQYNLPSAQLTLAHLHLLQNRPDSAVQLARRSFALSEPAGDIDNLSDAAGVLTQAYAQRGDFRQAFRYQALQLAYQDSLSGQHTQEEANKLRYGYALGRQQDQIALLTKNRQLQELRSGRQRQLLYGLLAGLAGLVLLALLLWRHAVQKQRANRRLNEQNAQIEAQRDALDHTLHELQATQAQLVQHEKMASLGELTAGVAHEIQNPLNFVNNFAELSGELVAELQAELADAQLPPPAQEAVGQLLADLAQNQQKIRQHGRRADGIVKSMLEHSRPVAGPRQPTDLAALAEEYLHLSYHGLRAKHPGLQVALRTEFAPGLPLVSVAPQEISRVLLNLLTNAFYSVAAKQRQLGEAYQPEVAVRIRALPEAVELRVRDNGLGIKPGLRDKIFQPFFTTKPVGEGTGLGLSLSYDIVTRGHGGTLHAESQPGEYAEFILTLPRPAAAPAPGVAPGAALLSAG